jgi:hypothetical protein
MHGIFGRLRRCVTQQCRRERLHQSAVGRRWLCGDPQYSRHGEARSAGRRRGAARPRLEAAMQSTGTRLLGHPFTSPFSRGAGAPSRESVMPHGTFPTIATAMSFIMLGLGAPAAAHHRFERPLKRLPHRSQSPQSRPGPLHLHLGSVVLTRSSPSTCRSARSRRSTSIPRCARSIAERSRPIPS